MSARGADIARPEPDKAGELHWCGLPYIRAVHAQRFEDWPNLALSNDANSALLSASDPKTESGSNSDASQTSADPRLANAVRAIDGDASPMLARYLTKERTRIAVMTPPRQVRAVFDDDTITVYQAYSATIAIPAAANNSFTGTPFKVDRMTWIKPSFLWMMYRSGWATKPGQEHVLAIQITPKWRRPAKRLGLNWVLPARVRVANDREGGRCLDELSEPRAQWR